MPDIRVPIEREDGCASRAVMRQIRGKGDPPPRSVLLSAIYVLSGNVDANLAEFRAEIKALNEVMVEGMHSLAKSHDRVEAKVDTLKDREELVSVTAKADQLWEERNRERAAKESAIREARIWKQEAKTQEGMVREIQDVLGIADARPGFEVAHIREAIDALREKPEGDPSIPVDVAKAIMSRLAKYDINEEEKLASVLSLLADFSKARDEEIADIRERATYFEDQRNLERQRGDAIQAERDKEETVDIEACRSTYRWDLEPSDSKRCQDCKARVFNAEREGPVCRLLNWSIADARKSVCSGWASVTGEAT